jgi:hypothetical protein
MVGKRKNAKTEPKRVKVAFDEAFSFASDKAKGVAEIGAASLKGAQKVVQARPWTTAVLTVGVSALIGSLALICGRSRES